MTRKTTKQTRRLDLRNLSDEQLDALLAVRHIVGTKRRWPAWAAAALGQTHITARVRTGFRRLLRTAWSGAADWSDHDALRTIARALGVELPAPPKRTRGAPTATDQPVRTRYPGQDPGAMPDGSPSTVYGDAGPPSDAELAEAAAQERARRHNARPEVWQPAESISEALHGDSDMGWW